MRTGAVADNDNLSSQSLPASVGDQASAGQALIVGMRRDNDKRPILKSLTQRGEAEANARRPELPRLSSPQILRAYGLREYPCRGVGQRAIGAGLAKIGCEVPRYALDRVRSHESLEPD